MRIVFHISIKPNYLKLIGIMLSHESHRHFLFSTNHTTPN